MHALKGRRRYQEDCGLALELGELLILGIADGFKKPRQSGLVVSKIVVREALYCISVKAKILKADPVIFLEETFEHIHTKTENFIAGSTFSLAIINRDLNLVTIGTVGDSIIALTNRDSELKIHPKDLLRERHLGLNSAFGDKLNAQYHTFKPSVAQHALGPESVLIISSDGLYPVTPENNMEAIEELAQTYTKMASEGAAPQDLNRYAAYTMNSPDNLTVAVYRAER